MCPPPTLIPAVMLSESSFYKVVQLFSEEHVKQAQILLL